ncbi:hypothetical protein PtB15_12B412 [Puccinia triticina]|nr:hypothetical protein PtB15_12B412 [Puccinia triticina]
MRFSFISGSVWLFLCKYSQGHPQTPQTPFQPSTLRSGAQPMHARAILMSPTGAPIYGLVEFRGTNLTDVQVEVIVYGLDNLLPHTEHAYHIHTNPIGADGNCEAAGGHLTPNGIPDSVPCNPSLPRACQEGDLSGKHGLLPGGKRVVHLAYTDNTLNFNAPENGIVGRGLVIHDGKARIACGNIVMMRN